MLQHIKFAPPSMSRYVKFRKGRNFGYVPWNCQICKSDIHGDYLLNWTRKNRAALQSIKERSLIVSASIVTFKTQKLKRIKDSIDLPCLR